MLMAPYPVWLLWTMLTICHGHLQGPKEGWYDGVSIGAAVLIVIAVTGELSLWILSFSVVLLPLISPDLVSLRRQ